MVKTATKRPPAADGKAAGAIPLASATRVFGIALATARARSKTLSPREKQLADLMAAGLPTAEIAERLGISPKTGDIHRANVKEKLGAETTAVVANMVNLVRLAERAGAAP